MPLILAAALLAASSGAASCTPVPGAEPLWRPQMRWVIVGEQHGTMETPAAFANLVCLAAATGRPVTVGLEYYQAMQPVIDGWLASDGGLQAQARLLTMPLWQPEHSDGRGSVAFLHLLQQLREMKQAGVIRGVVASVGGASPPPGQNPETAFNADMAHAWASAPAPGDGLVLVLVGNVHAIDKSPGDFRFTPAATFLPRARTATVNVSADGGQAWNREEDGYRPHNYTLHTGRGPAAIVATPDPARPWDYAYRLGVPFTPAPPAVAAPAS